MFLHVSVSHSVHMGGGWYPSMHLFWLRGLAWGVYRPTPRGEVEEYGLGGLQAHTRGGLQVHTWGGLQAHTRGATACSSSRLLGGLSASVHAGIPTSLVWAWIPPSDVGLETPLLECIFVIIISAKTACSSRTHYMGPQCMHDHF